MQQLSRGKVRIGGLAGPCVIKGSVTVDPPALTAGAKVSVALSVPGVAPGDVVYLEPPAALEAGILRAGHAVTAPGTVTLYLAGSATVDGAARTWTYTCLRTS